MSKYINQNVARSVFGVLLPAALMLIFAPPSLACVNYSLTLPNGALKYSAQGGSGTLTVTTTNEFCTWFVTVDNAADRSWLHQGQSTAGRTSYTVDANSGTQARRGTFKISASSFPPPFNRSFDYTYTVAVIQDGQVVRCPFSLDKQQVAVARSATSGIAVAIRTDINCVWTALSDSSWLTVDVAIVNGKAVDVVERTDIGGTSLFLKATENPSAERKATVTVTLLDPDINGGAAVPIKIDVTQSGGPLRYSLGLKGGAVYVTSGDGPLQSGRATVTPPAPQTAFGTTAPPSGQAIFGYQRGGVLVSEASVPMSHLSPSGRISAEINSARGLNTGIALASPWNETVSVSLTFTDTNGQTVRTGSLEIVPSGQIAAFLDQAPFNAPSDFNGTLTFRASRPLSAIALRGLINERSDFLITTLPVADISVALDSSPRYLPHFAAGSGWTSEIVLINRDERTVTGEVDIFPNGASSATSITYSIPARGKWQYSVPPGSSPLLTGWIGILPFSGTATPDGVIIFSYERGGVTISEAGVQTYRAPTAGVTLADVTTVYMETSGTVSSLIAGQTGAMQTGFALINISDRAVDVGLELMDLAGRSISVTSMRVPSLGQTARYIGDLISSTLLGNSFRGILRITGPVAVAGLRFRNNERSDTIHTTLSAFPDIAPRVDNVYFAHFVDGEGYRTQFIFIDTRSNRSGELHFVSRSGSSVTIPMSDQ